MPLPHLGNELYLRGVSHLPHILLLCQNGARTGSLSPNPRFQISFPHTVVSGGCSPSNKLCYSSSVLNLNGYHVALEKRSHFLGRYPKSLTFMLEGTWVSIKPSLCIYKGKKLRSRKAESCPKSCSCLLVYSSLLNTEGEKNEMGV